MILLPYQQIIDAVHAHTALIALGARNHDPAQIPPILHTDHSSTLIRVARDAAAIIAPRLADIGLRCFRADAAQGGLLADFDTEPDNAEMLSQLLIQAIKAKILYIAYTAAGLPADTLAADADAAISQALAATRRISPAAILPWPP